MCYSIVMVPMTVTFYTVCCLSPSSSEEEGYDVGSMPKGDNVGNWSKMFNPIHFPGNSELAYRESEQ